mmetsp:Transcript_8017/g.22923  ORF Transcript_8017/g.22923 Transcript_8017/m.22923 type:complete len:474 (+) Transcript_8017:43-1464(+)
MSELAHVEGGRNTRVVRYRHSQLVANHPLVLLGRKLLHFVREDDCGDFAGAEDVLVLLEAPPDDGEDAVPHGHGRVEAALIEVGHPGPLLAVEHLDGAERLLVLVPASSNDEAAVPSAVSGPDPRIGHAGNDAPLLRLGIKGLAFPHHLEDRVESILESVPVADAGGGSRDFPARQHDFPAHNATTREDPVHCVYVQVLPRPLHPARPGRPRPLVGSAADVEVLVEGQPVLNLLRDGASGSHLGVSAPKDVEPPPVSHAATSVPPDVHAGKLDPLPGERVVRHRRLERRPDAWVVVDPAREHDGAGQGVHHRGVYAGARKLRGLQPIRPRGREVPAEHVRKGLLAIPREDEKALAVPHEMPRDIEKDLVVVPEPLPQLLLEPVVPLNAVEDELLPAVSVGQGEAAGQGNHAIELRVRQRVRLVVRGLALHDRQALLHHLLHVPPLPVHLVSTRTPSQDDDLIPHSHPRGTQAT